MDPATIITLLTIAPSLYKKYRDGRDNFLDLDNLNEYQNRFADSFEDELSKRLKNTIEVDGIVSELESNRDEILDAIGENHVVDVTPVVEEITDQLTTLLVEKADSKTVSEAEIETAINEAYNSTLDTFVKNADDQDRPRLNSELNRVIQKDIDEIQDTVENIQAVLESNLEQEQAYKHYRIERDPDRIESLVDERIAQRLDTMREFLNPPEFDAYSNQHYVLIYGRKGSGKTRALSESVDRLVSTHDFDAVLYLNRSFRKLRHIDPVLNQQFEGDVLLIWDDTHDLGDRQLVENVLISLSENLDEGGGHDLWVRMTARREALDGVLRPSEQPAGELPETCAVDITPREIELGTLPVDTDNHFNTETVSKLVDQALAANSIADPDGLRDEFIQAVIEYEPTPAYIESACQTIAETDGVLTEAHIESLPTSTLDFWTQAYAKLRNESQYGESRRAILKAIALLDWINADVFAIPLVRQIAREAFGSTSEFSPDLEYLDSRGWVNVRDSPARVEVHDIRLEAIETPTEVSKVIDGFAAVMKVIADEELTLPAELSNDYPSSLNAAFAEQLRAMGNTDRAKTHYRRAALTTAATPEVHEDYAEFLDAEGRPEEARVQRKIATEMGYDGGRFTPDRKEMHEKAEQKLAYAEAQNKTTRYDKMTKREIRREIADQQTRERDRRLQEIKRGLHSDAFEAADPPNRLFSSLRRHEFDSSEEIISKMEDSGTPAGVVTDVLLAREVTSDDELMTDDQQTPRVEQSPKEAYTEILTKEFQSQKPTTGTEKKFDFRVLIELDTGLNKWLLLMDDETACDTIGFTIEEAEERVQENLGFGHIIGEFNSMFLGRYCHVITTPGGGRDELIVGDGEVLQAPPLVQTAKVYPQPSPDERAVVPSVATRTMVNELGAATNQLGTETTNYVPTGAVLPTGERASTVCFCGQVVEFKGEGGFRWTKLRDVFNGTIFVYTVNHYNLNLEDVSIEFPVIVTGEPQLIDTGDGETTVVVNLKTISNVSLQSCWLTTIEVGRQTLDRIEQFNTDPGMSELSRQHYDIESADELSEFEGTAETYKTLF